MKPQKFIFQVIAHKNGERTEPFVATWEECRATIRKAEVDEADYLLLVALIDPDKETDLVIPKTPLISVETLLKMTETIEA